MGIRSDLQMIERAVKRRWNFNRQLAEDAVEAGLRSTDDRVKVRALAIAVAMEKQNQADEHKVIDIGIQLQDDDVAAIAAELGIDAGVIFDAARIADGDTQGDSEETEAEADDAVGP